MHVRRDGARLRRRSRQADGYLGRGFLSLLCDGAIFCDGLLSIHIVHSSTRMSNEVRDRAALVPTRTPQTPHPSPYNKALTIFQKRGHIMYRLSEDEIREIYSRVKSFLRCEPSSAVVFAAMEKHDFHDEDSIVFLNTGRSPILLEED